VKPLLFVVEQSRKKVQDQWQLNFLYFLSWAPNKMIFWRKWCRFYSWHRLCWIRAYQKHSHWCSTQLKTLHWDKWATGTGFDKVKNHTYGAISAPSSTCWLGVFHVLGLQQNWPSSRRRCYRKHPAPSGRVSMLLVNWQSDAHLYLSTWHDVFSSWNSSKNSHKWW
jgi:hypothetical protein